MAKTKRKTADEALAEREAEDARAEKNYGATCASCGKKTPCLSGNVCADCAEKEAVEKRAKKSNKRDAADGRCAVCGRIDSVILYDEQTKQMLCPICKGKIREERKAATAHNKRCIDCGVLVYDETESTEVMCPECTAKNKKIFDEQQEAFKKKFLEDDAKRKCGKEDLAASIPPSPCFSCPAEEQDCPNCKKHDKWVRDMKAAGHIFDDCYEADDEDAPEDESYEAVDKGMEISEAMLEESHERGIEPPAALLPDPDMIISNPAENGPAGDIFTLRAEQLFTVEEVTDIINHFDENGKKVTYKPEPVIIKRHGLEFKFQKGIAYKQVIIKLEALFIKHCSTTIYYDHAGVTVEYVYRNINALIKTAIMTTPALYEELAAQLSAQITETENAGAMLYAKQGEIFSKMRDEGIFPGGMNVNKAERTKAFYEWAESEKGLKQSAVDKRIGVYNDFFLPAAGGVLQIKEEYKDYSPSVLLKIRKLIKNNLALPPASFTARQVDEYIKSLKAAGAAEPEVKNDFEAAEAEENADVAERLKGGEPINPDAPGIIRFKNDEAREEFLENYEDWPIDLNASPRGFWMRRAKLSNGAVIIANMYLIGYNRVIRNGKSIQTRAEFKLYKPDVASKILFNPCFDSESTIVNYIRENKLFAAI